MPKKSAKKTSRQQDSKLYAFLGVFLTIIGFLIVLLVRPKDNYAMYYAKQGLVIFIIGVIIAGIDKIPMIGNSFIVGLLWLLCTIVWIVAWINALSGEKRETFFIGEFANKIKI